MAVFRDGILYVDKVCRVCSRRGCKITAYKQWSKYAFYCIECYWIADRRATCTQRGKYKPEWNELRNLICTHCPYCGVELNYKCSSGARSNKATLQHYDDGHIGVICHTCNNAHGKSSLGDAYFDVPLDHKYCFVCLTIRHYSEMEKRASTWDGLGNRCKQCAAKASREYYKRKREKSGSI